MIVRTINFAGNTGTINNVTVPARTRSRLIGYYATVAALATRPLVTLSLTQAGQVKAQTVTGPIHADAVITALAFCRGGEQHQLMEENTDPVSGDVTYFELTTGAGPLPEIEFDRDYQLTLDAAATNIIAIVEERADDGQ